MNCSPWTIALVMIWTCQALPSYLKGKSIYCNVSPLAHFNPSPFPPKTLDWPTMTSTSASGSSQHWCLSWKDGKGRNLTCWRVISSICNCLQTVPWYWRTLLRNITVNSFSIISDVQLRSPTAFLQRVVAKFEYTSPYFVFFY